ncbi:FecR family protein [Sphingomonas nostoxanthinifaciens]|uniref:FecR family protein n=1 Tax=Sphingomonas nostoxanthinifaciens TaxID=2872652 RepID=UPI001CC1EEE7|nr:FecR domain-containing protein [Sphingomonas nostoxanthinifaciens]UAK23002.1 FecR domain-containing protein [Sphingomonas nostoxanthinifaciens]
MSNSLETAMDEAIAWHLGLEQAGEQGWHDFIVWMEADPAHAEAYDRLTLMDGDLVAPPQEAAPAAPVRALPTPMRGRHWQRWGGAAGGLAAAAAVAWFAIMPATVAPYALETMPGMHRTVTLADGTQVQMNGGTRLVLDRNNARVATLDRGEAIFSVVHHADHPFEVRSGGVTLRDVGTVFNVARSGDRLQVGVAEGEVMFQPEHEAVSIKRGMQLAVNEAAGEAKLTPIDAESVGGWSHGRLDFHDAALSSVADDVSRSTGAALKVSPDMAGRHFTGTLRLDRSPEEIARSLAALADGVAMRDGPGWMISSKSDGAP